MSEVAKLDGAISNCVAMETASNKLPNENCHKDGMTDGGLGTDVGKTEASLKYLHLDEGELDYEEEEKVKKEKVIVGTASVEEEFFLVSC